MQRKKPHKVLGVDYGMRRIGLAISDERKVIAFPLSVFNAEKTLKETVHKFALMVKEMEEREGIVIEKIVVGMPIKLSGKGSLMGDEVKLFIELLQGKMEIPIIAQDERLTTALAEKSLREGNMNRKQRAQVVDTVAASLVLQSYLDQGNLNG